jgi:hypothetical protein
LPKVEEASLKAEIELTMGWIEIDPNEGGGGLADLAFAACRARAPPPEAVTLEVPRAVAPWALEDGGKWTRPLLVAERAMAP